MFVLPILAGMYVAGSQCLAQGTGGMACKGIGVRLGKSLASFYYIVETELMRCHDSVTTSSSSGSHLVFGEQSMRNQDSYQYV